jgi:hypothetical protein
MTLIFGSRSINFLLNGTMTCGQEVAGANLLDYPKHNFHDFGNLWHAKRGGNYGAGADLILPMKRSGAASLPTRLRTRLDQRTVATNELDLWSS